MRISNRLKSIAKFIEHDDIVADIGCDHALLDIYLVENNIVKNILITDINDKALNNGIENIKKHNLEAKIKAKLGPGIEVIDKSINTLIISGMGANTICMILDNKNISQINKMIIQSNNDYYLLRKYITSIGFYISYEEVIKDNNKYYINIVFLRGYKKYLKKELIYVPLLINGNKEYFEYLYHNNLNILSKVPYKKIITRLRLKKENLFYKNLLNK